MATFLQRLKGMGSINYNYTLIIPNYNTSGYLSRLLGSIPQREDMQVIVVDDCSTTELEELQKLRLKYSWIEWYATESNGGGGKARNEGLKYAKGKWVLFADSDDYFTGNLNTILDEYKDLEYDIVYFNATVEDENGKERNRSSRVPRIINEVAASLNASKIKFRLSQPWAKLIKRELIDSFEIVFEESKGSNDVKFSIKTDFYAKNLFIDNRIFYVNVKRKNSVTDNRSQEMLLERYRISCWRYAFIKSHGYCIRDNEGYLGKKIWVILKYLGDITLRELINISNTYQIPSYIIYGYYLKYSIKLKWQKLRS